MEQKKKAIQILWERSKFLSILNILFFLIALYLFYASFGLPFESQIAVCGLGVALIVIGTNEFQHAIDAKKIEHILTKLDNVQITDETISPLAEGLISIIKGIDHIYKQK